ncbi:chemotaxis protein CheA [Tabrizicola sp. TH137]|uniref:chemotaxis protein CheA n=1 Tax=Tabrizicola sp. TH137 TaxID=2067452 RepID=UPI000C7B7521|nr:chemotaxis protein CheA [Tabrizicola sp. TH137]PLL10868.1 chemotaxis protein CheA [Tabrizicola sp. TH137]
MPTSTDLRAIFFEEADELLTALDEGLRAMSEGHAASEVINAVFRAVHSIKGGAAAFALHDLVAFAHSFESLLDELRTGTRLPDPDCIATLIEAADHLADLVTCERGGTAADPDQIRHALDRLKAFGQSGPSQIRVELPFDPVPLAALDPLPLAFDALPLVEQTAPPARVSIRFRPHPDALRSGHEPALILRDLAEIGEMQVLLDHSALTEAAAFDPTSSYLSWTITLQTDRTEAEIRAVFDFIALHADIDISTETEERPAPAAADRMPAPPSPPPLPAPAAPSAPRPVTADGLRDAAAAAQKATLRVDVERVDRLVNVAGELVIHNAMLTDAINRRPAADPHEVARSLDQLRQLSRMIQDSAMAIRAQPVKPLFDRMHRILREAAAATGKKARLDIVGEATEVDRTIIERLADPLTHMVRNAVDHGIELPERRRAAGKPEAGTVRIEAQHRSGRILIIVSDDGGGIDRARVQQIATERGLIPPTADLAPADVDALLFLPGFSTAKSVSALSGRGVGMDVVRSAILALGGRIGITSTPGEGTALRISLPLTLAVMDGMVVRAGGQPLVLPLSSIVETLSLDGADLHALGDGGRLVQLRGQCLPILGVAAALGLTQASVRPEDQVIIVVEREDKSRLALIVDGIDDQRQIVIKSLDENYGHIPGIAAATVLGDGSVALIIDPAELVQARSPRASLTAFSAAAE